MRKIFIKYKLKVVFEKIFKKFPEIFNGNDVFDTYLNFIKSLNISKIFLKASTKFKKVFYIRVIHNLLKFLKNCFKNFQNLWEIYPNICLIFFFLDFNKYYSKLRSFSKFSFIFSTVPQSLIEILSIFFVNFSKFL